MVDVVYMFSKTGLLRILALVFIITMDAVEFFQMAIKQRGGSVEGLTTGLMSYVVPSCRVHGSNTMRQHRQWALKQSVSS